MGSASELWESIGQLAGDLDVLDGHGLAALLQDFERLARIVEHAIVKVVGEADRRGVWAGDGHRSVRGWCMATANWSWGETTARLRTVTLLSDLASCDGALASGSVGVAQVRELARARANPRCGKQLVDVEEVLVRHARALPFDDFRRVVQRWEALADVDGAHRDHEAAHHNRNADGDLSGPEFHFSARGGAAQGAQIKEIFDRFVDAEFHADWDQCMARYGDDAATDLLARTAPQRRFDALHALFLAAASTPPDAQTPEPVVDIVVDQATFEAAIAAAVSGHPVTTIVPPAAADPTRRRCEILDGTLLDPLDVLTAAVVGHVRRVVYDSASTTIDLGRASRLFTGLSRLAVWLQGTRCIWPGCGHRHCQIDHSTAWNDSGPTNPANGSPLCGWHNRWKTRGYRTWRDASGIWHTYRPDGTEIIAA